MAVTEDTVWEVRTDGAATNGGGFDDLNPGTSVDYSQQASAQLSLSDIASDGAGTGISSATGGFTAAMEGNIIFIEGAGFTTGWYQITAYTDTNNITIDRSCGASQTGGTGNVGGAYTFNTSYDATFFNATNKNQYNVCWVKSGTYTITWNITIARSYFRFYGYNSTRGDEPQGTDRPYFSYGNNGNYLYFNSTATNARIEGLRVDQAHSSGPAGALLMYGDYSHIRNCKVSRSGYSGAPALLIYGTFPSVVQCECSSDTGRALETGCSNISIFYCYFHDSAVGIYRPSSNIGLVVAHCVIDTCSSRGINLYRGNTVMNCTVYNCGTGIYFYSSHNTAINNIIHTCTTGIYGAQNVVSDWNCIYNCTADYSNGVEAGENDFDQDPLLNDPANADFTLTSGSPCYNTGAKLGAGVGL
jgi:parallel beta-helix repeat protein